LTVNFATLSKDKLGLILNESNLLINCYMFLIQLLNIDQAYFPFIKAKRRNFTIPTLSG